MVFLPSEVEGLKFDAVVVADPEGIDADGAPGLRELCIAWAALDESPIRGPIFQSVV